MLLDWIHAGRGDRTYQRRLRQVGTVALIVLDDFGLTPLSRSMKTVDLKVRPIYHRSADRVRAHVFLCMLAYYVECHMRTKLAPVLFDDHDRAAGEQLRESVVQPAQRSPAAHRKAASKRTDDDLPMHSFRSLMSDLGTLVVIEMHLAEGGGTFSLPTQPTPVQRRCFEFLGVPLRM